MCRGLEGALRELGFGVVLFGSQARYLINPVPVLGYLPTSTHQFPKESTMRKRPPGIVLAALVILGVSAMGIPIAGAKAKTHTITGTIQIISTDVGASLDIPAFSAQENPCDGSEVDGFDDLSVGADVTVKSGAGKIIGVGELRGGKQSENGSSCTMPFKVKGVPETSFYQIKIGNRGGIAYSLAKMKRKNWHVPLTIGS